MVEERKKRGLKEMVKFRKGKIKISIVKPSEGNVHTQKVDGYYFDYYFLEEDIDDIIKNNLMVSVSNIELCGKLNESAEKQNKMVNIHIKVDTGMTRLGFDAKKAVEKALYI